MKWIGTKNLGLLLLAIWLIVSGVLVFVHLDFIWTAPIMAALAIAAGVLLLLGALTPWRMAKPNRRDMKHVHDRLGPGELTSTIYSNTFVSLTFWTCV